jgi:hypothetical protein
MTEDVKEMTRREWAASVTIYETMEAMITHGEL